MKKAISLFLILVISLTLLNGIQPLTAKAADDITVFEASEMPTFQRSQKEIVDAYVKAFISGENYVDGDRSTYYEVPASTVAPYNKGVLAQDTLDAMIGMTNFYRVLSGMSEYALIPENNAGLQAEALDRNFEHAHEISYSSKPSDMPDDIWNEGFYMTHNILAWGYTPRRAIDGWMNEGFSLYSGEWESTGHRMALLHPGYTGIEFGYSGNVSVGRNTGRYILYNVQAQNKNNCKEAFGAFPCPGPMPNWVLDSYYSAWSCVVNTDYFLPKNSVKVTVTNLSTNESYECTRDNGMLRIGYASIDFVQPIPDRSGLYTSNYQVEITGLTDVKTSKDAKIIYTVEFFGIDGWLSGWHKVSDNQWCLFDGSGLPVTGWYNDSGNWYYLNKKGVTQVGWQNVDGEWYYLDQETAIMATGWKQDEGNWYHLNASGVMETGWALVDGQWYLMSPKGKMLTGWQLDSGYWYYLNEAGGNMLANCWKKDNGCWYHFSPSGDMQTGWQLINGYWYLFSPSGIMLTGWQQVAGKWYYFYESGQMAADTQIGSYIIDKDGVWVQ